MLVTLSLDHALWGLAPVGYHLTNVWLHALNAALVLLLFRLIPRTRPAAFPAAILFACHPLQTNAAAYISGRTDLLAALFVLLGCILLARRLALPGPSGAGSATACAVGLCTALAAMSKESAFAAPLLLLLTGALSAPSRDGKGAPPAPGRRGVILRLAGASAAALCLVLVCRRLAGLPPPAPPPPPPPLLLPAPPTLFL